MIHSLSQQRMSTFLAATNGDADLAVELYGWNARISGALLVPAHLAEVTTRNAVDHVLCEVYGDCWPWNQTFERSLPQGRPRTYSARRDLESSRRSNHSTGKVIAELKFVFWQQLFTARHDARLWVPYISSAFPGATSGDAAELRQQIWTDIEIIRRLRNRIAHHEPIIARDLASDLETMIRLIELRSPVAAAYAGMLEDVTQILTQRPRLTPPTT